MKWSVQRDPKVSGGVIEKCNCSAWLRLKLEAKLGSHTHPPHPLTTNFSKGSSLRRTLRFDM